MSEIESFSQSDDTDDDLPTLLGFVKSTPTSYKTKTLNDLFEENVTLLKDQEHDQKFQEEIKAKIETLESNRSLPDQEIPFDEGSSSEEENETDISEEPIVHFFGELDKLQFFTLDDVTLLNCGFELKPNLSKQEKFLLLNENQLHKVIKYGMCDFSFSKISQLDPLVKYVLKTMSLHNDESYINACQKFLQRLFLKSYEPESIALSNKDIFMILFNYGVDTKNRVFNMPEAEEISTNSDEISFKLPKNWIFNLKIVLIILKDLINWYTFENNDMCSIIIYLLWMSLDDCLLSKNIHSELQGCIALALTKFSDEFWPDMRANIAQFLMLENISLCYKWSYILKMTKFIPYTIDRGVELRKYISYSVLKRLTDEDSEILFEYSDDLFSISHLLPILESICDIEKQIQYLATKFIDIFINHLKLNSQEDYYDLSLLLRMCENSLGKNISKAQSHLIKMYSRISAMIPKENIKSVINVEENEREIFDTEMESDLEITCEKADSFSPVSTPPSFQLNNSKDDFLTESSNDSSEEMLSNKAVNFSENIEKDGSKNDREIINSIDLKSSDMLETKRKLDYSSPIISSSILCSPYSPVINKSSDEILTVKQNISLGQSFSKSPDQNQVVTHNETCPNEFSSKEVNKRNTRILKYSSKKKPCRSKKKHRRRKKASEKIPRDEILSTINESRSDDKFYQMSAVDSMCSSSNASHKQSRVFNYLSDILKECNISEKKLNKSEAKLFKRGYEETSSKIKRKIRKVFRRKLFRKMHKKSKLKKESLVHNTNKLDKTSFRGNSNELSAENNVQNDLVCNNQPQDSNIFSDILEKFNISSKELSKYEAKLYNYGFKNVSKKRANYLRKFLKTKIKKKVAKRIINDETSQPSNEFPVHYDNKLDITSYILAEDSNAVKAQMNVDILTNEEIKHSPSSVSDDFLEGSSITQSKENLISNNKNEVNNIARLEKKTIVMNLESVNFYVPNNNETKNKLVIHAEKPCDDIQLLGTTSSNCCQNIAVNEKSGHEMVIKNDLSDENASHNIPMVINRKCYQDPKFWRLSNFIEKPDISHKNIPGILNDPIAPDKEMSMQDPSPCDFDIITIKNIEMDHNYSTSPINHVISKSNNNIHVDSSVSPLSNEPQNTLDLEDFKKSSAFNNLTSYEMLNKTQNISRDTVKTTVHDQNDSDKLVQLMSAALNDSRTDVLKEKSLDANDCSIIKNTRDKMSPIISDNLLKEKKHKTTIMNSSLSISSTDRVTISNLPKKSASQSNIRSNKFKSKIITPEKECNRNDEIQLKGKKSSIIKMKENIKILHPETKKITKIEPNSTVIKPKVDADSSYFSISVNTSLSKPENKLSESPRKKIKIHTNPLSFGTTNENSLTKSTPLEFSKIRIIGQKEGSGSSKENLRTSNPSHQKKRETTSDVNVNKTKIIVTPVKKSKEKEGKIFMRDKKTSENSNNIVTNNVQEKDNQLSSFSHLNGFLDPENAINSISDQQENCGQLPKIVQPISDKAMESHNECSDSKASNDGNLLPFDHRGKKEFRLSSSSFSPDFHDLKNDLSSVNELSQENYDQLTKVNFQCSVLCKRIKLCSNHHFKNAKMPDSLNKSESLQDNFQKPITSRISVEDSKLDFQQNSPSISVAESIHLSKEDSNAIILNSLPKDLFKETHLKSVCATGPVSAEFQKNTKYIADISSNLNGSCSNEAKDCVNSDGKNISYIELSDSEEEVQILKCFDNKISTNEKSPLKLVHSLSETKEYETKNLGTQNSNPEILRTEANFSQHVSIKESPSKTQERQKSNTQTYLSGSISSQDTNAFKQSPSKATQKTSKAHKTLSTESNNMSLRDCGITYTKSPKKSGVNSSQINYSPKIRKLNPSPVTVKSDINSSATSNKEDIVNIHCSSKFDSDCFIIDSGNEPQLIIIE